MTNNTYSFQIGHQKFGGRTKGTPNKVKISTVREFFVQNKINPIAEIMGLMNQISEPAKKANIWMQLLSWYEPRPSRVEIYDDNQPDTTTDALTNLPNDVLMDMLKKGNPDFCQKCWSNIAGIQDSHVCRQGF